jgi:spermidine dehydrogenase
MSYGEFIRNVMKLDSRPIARFFDQYLAVTLGGTVDGVSAFGARTANLPGVSAADWRDPPADAEDISFAFPMGNAIYPRLMVRAMLPAAYQDGSLTTLVYGQTRREELDRPQNATRIRLGSTAVSVQHDGSPGQANTVSVIYDQGGKLHRVRARGVVMACGGWVSRRVVRGMPEDLLAGFYSFNHTPVLVANVAVRHWRFLDKLGIAAAQWFEGFGFATNIRRPMRIDGKAEVFSPDKPTILTFYAPILEPASTLPVRVQTTQGRQRLFASSFADFEQRIRAQMQEMFGPHGFDAKRDIGAIILNRWGHAFIVPEPGFFFGRDAQPAARDLARKGFGRIAFGSAELQGQQVWFAAYEEGRRAALQVV